MRWVYPLVMIIASMSSPCLYAYGQKGVFIGSVQFPSSIKKIPDIRIYNGGRIAKCQIDEHGKKNTFTLIDAKHKTLFFLLITPKIEYVSRLNTIGYLKLKKELPHKFYVLELVQEQKQPKGEKRFAKATSVPTYTWRIQEVDLSTTPGRIPDETITVCYHPDLVQGLEGGNQIELPKIVIRPDVLQLVGSCERLEELSNQWFLAALNTDTLHESIPTELKTIPQPKTLLTLAA